MSVYKTILTQVLALTPVEMSNIEQNLMEKLKQTVYKRCICNDKNVGFILNIHRIINRGDAVKRNESFKGEYIFNVLYEADIVMYNNNDVIYGVFIDSIDKLGIHASNRDYISVYIESDKLPREYMELYKKGDQIDVSVLCSQYTLNSKDIVVLGNMLHYFTIPNPHELTFVISPSKRSRDKDNFVNVNIINIDINLSNNSKSSIFYKTLCDPLSSLKDSKNINFMAMSELLFYNESLIMNINNSVFVSKTINNNFIDALNKLNWDFTKKINESTLIVCNVDEIESLQFNNNCNCIVPITFNYLISESFKPLEHFEQVTIYMSLLTFNNNEDYTVFMIGSNYINEHNSISNYMVTNCQNYYNSIMNRYYTDINVLYNRYKDNTNTPIFKEYLECKNSIANAYIQELKI